MKDKRKLLWLFFVSLSLTGLLLMTNAQDGGELYNLPGNNAPVSSSSSMILANDGRTAVTANMLNNTISFVDLALQNISAEIPVGHDPRTVAFTDNNDYVLVVNRADGTLSVVDYLEQKLVKSHHVGILPYAVVTNNDETAFVSLQGTDEVVLIEITTGRILARIDTPDAPTGLTLWGDFLYVVHMWSGDVSLIHIPQMKVVSTLSTGRTSSLSMSLLIDSSNRRAYFPQSLSNNDAAFSTYDSLVAPVVNIIELGDYVVNRKSIIALDIADRPVNIPFAAALDTNRDWLYVVNAGSSDVSVIDTNTGRAVAHVNVGTSPRSIVLARDFSAAYVHNAIDGSISVIDPSTIGTIRPEVFPISDLNVPIDVLIGAQLFYTSNDSRISQDNWVSCASCHFDGQSDGRVWQDFQGKTVNTPLLFGLEETAPYTWSGEWDELADTEYIIRYTMAGEGLVDSDINAPLGDLHDGLSLDLDTLVTYLQTLQAPIAPQPIDTNLVNRGSEIFEDRACGSCHSGDMGTDGLIYDVGTGGEFDVPTLNWLWMSAPYFHDGRAESLRDVFILPGEHQLLTEMSSEDVDALISYLLSRPE